ncbi:MAG: SxtJ family membrane protein [Reichenbachiella sp.]
MEQDLYKNITVITGGFLVIALIFDIQVLEYAAATIAVGSFIIPPFGRLVNWLWLKLALGLGWINSRILLSIIYYVFLFPIALASRLFNRDSLKLKKIGDNESYYSERNHKYSKADLENIW